MVFSKWLGKIRKLFVIVVFVTAILVSVSFSAVCSTADASGYADKLYTLGLFNGVGENPDGLPDFALNRPATRAEATAILVRLIGKEAEALQGGWTLPFTDVPGWAMPYIGYAYANNITKGVGSDTFGSGRKVSAPEFITLILRSLGYTSGEDFEWKKAWILSDSLGITDGRYETAETFLRSDIAAVSFNALSASFKDSDETLCSRLIDAGVFSESQATSVGLSAAVTISQEQTPLAASVPKPVILDVEQAIFDLINAERAKNKLAPLTWDDDLAAVARAYSKDMRERRYFSHISPEGETPADRMRGAGIPFRYAGENLAKGFVTPESVIAAWMASPTHKQVILGEKAEHVGVGYYEYFWTSDFSG